MPKTLLQLVKIDETGDSCYRIKWPAEELCCRDLALRLISLDAADSRRFEWARLAELLVLYQSQDVDMLPILEKRRALGRKTVVEYNDNFYSPPLASPAYGTWSNPRCWQIYERFMELADLVVVSSEGLKELFSKKTDRPIRVIDNAFPLEPIDLSEKDFDFSSEIRMGWAGSLGHFSDLLTVAPVIRELLGSCNRLKFFFMGNEDLFRALDLPAERSSYRSWGNIEQYYDFLKGLHIGLAPLLDTPYNRCRTDIKAVEMGAFCVLPLLSSLSPYRNFAERNGLPTFSSSHELSSLVDACLGDPLKIREKAMDCRRYVLEQRLLRDYNGHYELYRPLIEEAEPAADWLSLGPGYHELKGELSPDFKRKDFIKERDFLVSQGESARALELMKSSVRENPFDVELALEYLSLLSDVASRVELLEELRRLRDFFPEDIRLSLFVLNVERDPLKLLSMWSNFIESLKRCPGEYKRSFGAAVIRIFLKHLKGLESLVYVGEELCELFPNSAALCLEMAELLEKLQDYKGALTYYERLRELSGSFEANRDFFKESPNSRVVEAWIEVLKARI